MLSCSFVAQFARKKPAVTCTEVVHRAFQKERGFTEEYIDDIRKFGHGKAPGGECGALWSAKRLSKPGFEEQIEKEFVAEAGDTKCKKIRRADVFSCDQCKALGIKLIKKYQ